uniref:Uncharacterized protein n=1 Tax=Acrobeloides nanus TaxID=290746 RepID=A0A914E8A1_9BILA
MNCSGSGNMLGIVFLVIFSNFIDSSWSTNRCYVGRPGKAAVQGFCPLSDGCAIVRYKGQFGDLNGRNHDRYQCFSELEKLHPAFTVTNCSNGASVATCYDINSRDKISYTARAVGVMEQTFGEVLRLHNIEKFCCCKEDLCNRANEQVINFFAQPTKLHLLDDENEQMGDAIGYNPGQIEGVQVPPEQTFVQPRPRSDRVTNPPDPNSVSMVFPSFFIILVCMLMI